MDEIFEQTQKKLKLIETATLLKKNQNSILCKDEIEENLSLVKENVQHMSNGIMELKMTLENLKMENERCKIMLSSIETLSKKMEHMEKNVPKGIKDYLKLQETENTIAHKNCEEKENMSIVSNSESFTPSMYSSTRDCKKLLFKELEIYPVISPLTQEEFAKIPKYIIGRQTLETINSLIDSINKIIKVKYTVLSLGKNGARKKGDLDVYLEYKKQQTSVEEAEGKIYFFTAEDYQKQTSSKLDKIKLNMITALRSCKKLREIRIGKLLYYMVVQGN